MHVCKVWSHRHLQPVPDDEQVMELQESVSEGGATLTEEEHDVAPTATTTGTNIKLPKVSLFILFVIVVVFYFHGFRVLKTLIHTNKKICMVDTFIGLVHDLFVFSLVCNETVYLDSTGSTIISSNTSHYRVVCNDCSWHRTLWLIARVLLLIINFIFIILNPFVVLFIHVISRLFLLYYGSGNICSTCTDSSENIDI